jgi:uncharacterized protein (DUF302 family)
METLQEHLNASSASSRPAPDGRIPFRLWMTGSLAVVMASLCTGRGVLDDQRLAGSMRLLRHSPYGVNETVLRIEEAARQRGQSVLLRLGDAGTVIVLSASAGGTPVVMAHRDSPPDMPLSVQVRRSANGGADVLVAMAGSDVGTSLDGLPADVAEDVAALPALLERALA